MRGRGGKLKALMLCQDAVNSNVLLIGETIANYSTWYSVDSVKLPLDMIGEITSLLEC